MRSCQSGQIVSPDVLYGLVAAREKAGAVKAERFNTNPSKPVDGRMREHRRLRKAAELIKRISGVRVT
jgi:hypothetical protein